MATAHDPTPRPAHYVRPTPFEVATAGVFGLAPPTPMPPTAPSPRRALEDAIRPALLAPPCYVTFSGGRDSSAMLAVAVDLARREGHALPIPATKVYPAHPRTDESTWQRQVVDHLGLSDWLRVEYGAEIELLGPVARASLRDRGLVWPPALQVHGEWYERLAPGSVITGEGGDEVLGARRGAALRRLRRRSVPDPRVVGLAAESLLPLPLRIAAARRRTADLVPAWLTPPAADRYLKAAARDRAFGPLRHDDATWLIGRRRAWQVYLHNHALVGADSGVMIHEPLLAPSFLAALAHEGGRWGYTGRTGTMRALFSDLLPLPVIARSTKASFDDPYTGESMRAFGQSWDGTGIDPALVDADRLRAAWLADRPMMMSSLLLQQAWLHAEGLDQSGSRSS